MNNYQNGHLAEYMAMWFLRFRGYRLLFQNYRCGRGTHAGEVDLIMLKKKTVVFIEVKQRQTLEKAAYAVLAPAKKRIRRAAEAFLSRHPQYMDYGIRFDAVLVSLPFKIVHLPNAF